MLVKMSGESGDDAVGVGVTGGAVWAVFGASGGVGDDANDDGDGDGLPDKTDVSFDNIDG